MSNIDIRSTNFSSNPIVIQLCEFGYDSVYSRRVFHYLHPEDLEEALNYMAIENGIIQHRFVYNRNTSNHICYVCGKEKSIHLKELNININVNAINSEKKLEKNKKEQKENNKIKTSGKINNNKHIFDSSITKNFESGFYEQNSKNFLFSKSKEKSYEKEIKREKHKKPGTNKKEVLKSKKPKIECEVCNEMFTVNEKNKVKKCGHAFCSNCWYDYLSIKIKENKLPSIKCLNYNCKEKLSDKFIIRLLKSDINLIRKYKRYKLELEIINDPNKKLCPYPNCDSYLELKQIRNKDVTCKNNHTFCFECLKKPHGKLPCNANLDKSMKEYAKNNFVKKCPKCSIITEKNDGCNHITCTKCGYQWCWLCNQEYNVNHFKGGKCKGFQFFQPKNEYEIKLMMEGKINYDELSENQRQYNGQINDNNFDIYSDGSDSSSISYETRNQLREMEIQENELYNSIKCPKRAFYVFFFVIFGNCYFILKGYNLSKNILVITIYILLTFSFFFQIIFLNILSFIYILIYRGFKGFILKFDDLQDLYLENFIIIFVNILIGNFCFIVVAWRKLLYKTQIDDLRFMKFLIYSAVGIMSIIIYFPQHLLVNIASIIIYYIFFKKRSFFDCTYDLDKIFEKTFNFNIKYGFDGNYFINKHKYFF